MSAVRTDQTPDRAWARLGTLIVGIVLAVLTVFAPAASASATAPYDLGGAYVSDQAGVLTTSQKASVTQAVQRLYSETKTQLYVVFVPSFTDPTDHTAWGTAFMQRNQIDSDGILLAVAVNDRAYDVQQSSRSASTISSSDVQQTVNNDLLPKLKTSDWSGAATAFANGLAQTQAPPNLTWLWVVLALIVVLALAFVFVRRRRRAVADRRREAEASASLANLERQAKGALVQIDDELTTAAQEIEFAVAQFGADAAKPFRDTLDQARSEVRRAFTLQQQLDDEVPDTAAQREQWSHEIIDICATSHAALEAQTESFDQLRGLEDGVEQASAELTAALPAGRASVAASTTALERLRGSYSGKTLAMVDGNASQATALLDYATERAEAATTSIATGDRGAAVIAVRDGQHALAQVTALTTGVTGAAEAFAEATARVDALRTDLEADLAAAGALGTPSPDLAAAVTRVRAALGQATDPKDPIGALDRLTAANQAIDQALAGARAAADQRERATRALDAALRDARARISQAREFIALRRGGVGPTARTRLSEAERALDDAVALATSDPAQAVQAARDAEQYAAAAMDAADNDLGGWPGAAAGGGGAQLGGLVTGLVLGGMFGGRGGFGGFGGGGFGGGGGGGFGDDGGGGFGGGGGDGGFSGGGRF